MLFELHITVNCDNIERFKKDCAALQVKPIIIDTGYDNQVMTSSKYMLKDFEDTLLNLQTELIKKKYNIVRCKVEIKPESIKHKDFLYYETHFRLKLTKNFDKKQLETICQNQNFHLSKNLFKQDDLYDYQMITHRNKNKLSDFNQTINVMKNKLVDLNIHFDKIEIEECILDTNEKIDYQWLNMN